VACLRDAISEAAGRTHALAPASVLTPVARRRRRSRWPAIIGALVLAGAGAALAAALVVGSGGGNPRVATVTLGGTTVHETVTTTPAGSTKVAGPPVPGGAGGHSLNDEGYRLMQGGSYAAALPLLQQAVQKLRGVGPSDPYEAYANYNLGYTLWKLGRCAEAVPYVERAKELEPSRHEPEDLLKQARRC
jgi:TolA-binding protein